MDNRVVKLMLVFVCCFLDVGVGREVRVSLYTNGELY